MDWSKPTLQHLRQKYAIPARVLAMATGLPQRIVYLAEIGGAVSRDEAARILQAFSHLLGRPVTFREVHMNVRYADEETQPLPTLRTSRIEAWRRATHMQNTRKADHRAKKTA